MEIIQPNGSEQVAKPRERILSCAHNLFYSQGIRATGVDQLIAESSVTKTTFYRQFRSKNELILAFLDFRHERWIDWFAERLAVHGGTIDALHPTLAEWFNSEHFRGCAFINSLSEVGETIPGVVEAVRSHKQEMTDLIETLLTNPTKRKQLARSIAIAVDGAIVRAQFDQSAEQALADLDFVLELANCGESAG